VREFLAHPPSADAKSDFASLKADAEAAPFLPPELRWGSKGGEPRTVLSYRMAAQIHVLLEGRLPGEDSPDPDAKTIVIPVLSKSPLPVAEADVPRELVRLGLSLRPEDRPDPLQFLTLQLSTPKSP